MRIVQTEVYWRKKIYGTIKGTLENLPVPPKHKTQIIILLPHSQINL